MDVLRSFLNVRSDQDFVLIVAWLLAALRDRGPYPVLGLSGEQGTAKSTLARLRTGGQQTVKVVHVHQHVMVGDGGQAVVAGSLDSAGVEAI